MVKNILILSLIVFLLTTCSKDKTPDRLLARFGQDYQLLLGTWTLNGTALLDYYSRKYYSNSNEITLTFDEEANITLHNKLENIVSKYSSIELIKDLRVNEKSYIKVLKLNGTELIYININVINGKTKMLTNFNCVTDNTYQYCNEIQYFFHHEFSK